MHGGISPPDLFTLQRSSRSLGDQSNTNGLTPRSITINPAHKTLVLLALGQSQLGNILPTLYTPTNTSVIDHINIYDGAFYPITGRLLGVGNGTGVGNGPGNILAILADTFVTNGIFNRVILAPIAVGGTQGSEWQAGGALSDRSTVVIRRLAARGITPQTTGVTFGCLIGLGETDGLLGTSAASYTASINSIISVTNAAGFSGRYFLTKETWLSGTVYPTIQNAQTALVNNTTIWSGGNLDSLDATKRDVANVHFNDAGGSAAAALIYAAMHASGSPY